MPSKTEEYLALAQRTANGLTRYWESWTDYLTTASRLYKYPFADQLMIYAQRPDATACADFDIWNNRMNRYVRRGAKGIALLDESSGFPRLHYVFDVSDTGVRRNSRDPEVWQFNDDLKQPVSEMLSKTYGIGGERVSQQLADIAGKLVADYWDNNGGDIRAIVDGSLLMDYDEAGVEMQFKSAAAISVTYTLLERCGFEPAGWFDKDDFQAIHDFSTPDSVYALGAAVSDMSREVLRNIERTVKTTIRRHNAERSQYEYEQQERDLLDRRGLPLPNLILNQPRKPLGKYGRLRRTYLKEHRPVLYHTMLLNGSLYPHLMEVEQTAESRMQQTMEQLLKQTPAPDKEQNQMAWVQHMNSLKAQAEELVLTELIYS
nr:TnpV protein [Faecalibacterium prausnitzii]